MAAVPVGGILPEPPAAAELGVMPPVGGPEFLLLPEPEGGVLNHGGADNVPEEGARNPLETEKARVLKTPSSLEDLCVDAYLKYLETEIVTYISLTQSKSLLVKGVAKRMLQILKDDINTKLTGVASSVIREKMVSLILSENFPSMEYCNMFVSDGKDDQENDLAVEEEDIVVHACPNICCTGAFIQEGMMGVVMSAEVRQLIFTVDKVKSRRHFPGTLEFNVPVVLTHLLGATDGRVSQLERLVFSENFVKEETETTDSKVTTRSTRMGLADKQQSFARHFGQGNIYDTSDRRGIAVDLLILFRDIHPRGLQYQKLTELILKNNIQCKLYSKANFQFEFLARIGFCCPKLRVFDVFGTDTWADCLIALFFRDAFHSLHRYLYFMENEDDECSEYHPHDTSRYCQFCLDQWHPNMKERPYTNNPVIPLLDSVYNHVIKRYPKRSFCILRNCVRVSDLIHSKESTVFELVRPGRAPSCQACCHDKSYPEPVDPLSIGEVGIKSRLRKGIPPLLKLNEQSGRTCCDKILGDMNGGEPSTGPGADNRGVYRSCRQSGSPGPSTSAQLFTQHNGPREARRSQEKWILAPRSPEKRICPGGGRQSVSKSREYLSSIIEENGPAVAAAEAAGAEASQSTSQPSSDHEGMMTRARKRKLQDLAAVSNAAAEAVIKKAKMDWRHTLAKGGADRQLRGTTNRRSSKVGGKSSGSDGEQRAGVSTECDGAGGSGTTPAAAEEAVIPHDQWLRERDERDFKYPATICNKAPECMGPAKYCDHHDIWYEPEIIKYRQIQNWPHLNACVTSLEILNIGGSNVLGEFLPFLLLHTPNLKSLGQWLNTMIYGLEILKDLPGYENYKNYQLQEFSYSSDRNYFCQPYIGFVPESSEFKNVRKEMVRYSNKSATRVGHKQKLHSSKRRQIREDIDLMVTSCPNLRKVNIVVHYKNAIMEETHVQVWEPLLRLSNLVELDLVTMKFENVRSLLTVIGPKLQKLTVECDEEQGTGSEIVHLARHCPNISSLRILLGEKILRGEMTLHFGQTFFRKLERLTVEGNVHLHGFAFLWGHCQNLKYMKIGLVVSNELTNTNVLIQDVFNLLFQVNKMAQLEELHIKNLKIRTLGMGLYLLDNLPNLKKASNWFLDLYGEDVSTFKKHLRTKGLVLDYDRL